MSDSIPKIVVTGASGQVAYALLFRLAAGELYGRDQRIALVLLDISEAEDRVAGVAMELADGAFPLLSSVIATSDPACAFEGADVAFLIGSRPRASRMERSDLLAANAEIFATQGRAINSSVKENINILVVVNPANTNSLILASHASRIRKNNITALMRLDHNRAISMLAKITDVEIGLLNKMAVWGNHSATMYADVSMVEVAGEPIRRFLPYGWNEDAFIADVAQRGATIIRARGLSSAGSAAAAALDHMRNWINGSDGQWVSMGVFTNDTHGFDSDLVVGVPVICNAGKYVVAETVLSERARRLVDVSISELRDERALVSRWIT